MMKFLFLALLVVFITINYPNIVRAEESYYYSYYSPKYSYYSPYYNPDYYHYKLHKNLRNPHKYLHHDLDSIHYNEHLKNPYLSYDPYSHYKLHR